MPLPIIIIPERHTDIELAHIRVEMIPILANLGYDTISLEAPADITTQEILDRSHAAVVEMEALIETIQQYVDGAVLNFGRTETMDDLLNMELEPLCQYLRQFVSSQHYADLALKILGYRPATYMPALAEAVEQHHMELLGCDIEQSQYDDILTSELSSRVSSEAHALREQAMFNNLMKLYRSRQGVVAFIGKDHLKGLHKLFKDNLAEDILLIEFPHGSKRYDTSQNLLTIPEGIRVSSATIDGATEKQDYLAALEQRIQLATSDVTDSREIETSTLRLLKQVLEAEFYFSSHNLGRADAKLDRDGGNIEHVAEQLTNHGILFQHGNDQIIVKDINDPEVAEHIWDTLCNN